MRLPRFANKLALLGAFLLCISLGFGAALVLKDRLSSTAEADPCFGLGQLTGEWQHDVTQEDIDSSAGLSPQLADRKPGLTEFRTCKTERGDSVIIDEHGHVFSYTPPTLDELKSYYAAHPDENPQNQIATSQAESREEMSVTPALPDPTKMEQEVLAGCDPSWHVQDFPSVGLRLCYPGEWQVLREKPEVTIGNDVTTMYFTSKADHEMVPDCPDPAVIATTEGDAKLCEAQPNLMEPGQGHSLILPNRHQVRYFITEPTPDSKWLALRIALSAEDLP